MSTEELPVNGMKGSIFIFCAEINSRPGAQSRLKVPYAQGKHRLTCRQCAEWNREMIYVNKAQRSWKLDLAVSLKVLCFWLEYHKNIDVMLYVLNQIFSVKNCRYDSHLCVAACVKMRCVALSESILQENGFSIQFELRVKNVSEREGQLTQMRVDHRSRNSLGLR